MEQKYIVGDVVMYDNKIMVVKEPRVLDEYVPPPTRKERRKRERELKKKFPLDLTKFIESHRT